MSTFPKRDPRGWRRALFALWRFIVKVTKVIFILVLVMLPIPIPAFISHPTRRKRSTDTSQVLKKD